MKLSKENRIRTLCELAIGIMLILTVVVGYLPQPQYMIELTFLSNLTLGLVFLATGIRSLLGKKPLPNLYFSSGVVTIMIVFLVCMGSLSGMYHMNFKGAFLFLHVINPLALLVYYMVFVNERRDGKARSIWLIPCGVMLYLVFDYMIGKVRGQFVYGFVTVEALTVGKAVLAGIVSYIVLLGLGYLLYCLNVGVRKKIK